MKLLKSSVHQTGDTIVEVMVSMTILALVLGVAFATSRHSFQNGLDSSYRDQAQAYAEQQAELIKQLDSSGALSSAYQSSAGFCIDPTTQAPVALVNGSCPLPVGSSGSSSSQYTLVDKYDATRMKYTVLVQWPSANTSVPNSVTLQYKPQNSFVTTPGSFNPPVSTITTPLSGGWPSLSTDWAGAGGPSAPSVPYATALHLTWSTVPTAQSCSGSTTPPNLDAGWNGAKAIAGSYATSGLTSSVTYNLACNPFGGGAAQQSSVPITVSAEPAPVTTISPTSQTINSGGTATFNWSSTNYSTGCTASGNWSGARTASGSYTTPALAGPATYTYSIYCTGPGGNSPTVSASVVVNAPPPPPPYATLYQCGTAGVAGCSTPFTGYSQTVYQNGAVGLGTRYYGSLQFFNAVFTITIYDNRGVCEYFYHYSGNMGEHINGGIDKVYRNPMVTMYGYVTGGNCSNQT